MKVVFAIFLLSLTYVAAGPDQEDLIMQQKIVDEVNSNPKSTWTAGFNENFAGWSVHRAKRLMGVQKSTIKLPEKAYVGASVPSSFDSRTQWGSCIGKVLNQADCGSCWAFGAAEAISDRVCISKNGSYVQRAPLDLVSCDYGFMGNNGCEGGQLGLAWQYAQTYGLVSEACMPYGTWEGGPIPTCPPKSQPCLNFVNTPKCNKTCANGKSYQDDKLKISSVYSVSADATSIAAEIMKNGPVEAAFTVYADFVHYKSGVYSHQTGSVLGGHAIKIIGWGVENGTPYWTVQNSWTTTWGADGYFKIRRGTDECGIEDGVVAGTP